MIADIIAIARRLAGMIKRLQRRQALSVADREYASRLIAATAPAPAGRPREEIARLPIYDSMHACAGATGIPLAFLRHAKKSACPAFTSNRVHLAELLRWMFAKSAACPDAEGIDWSDELKKWLAKRAKIQHDRDAETIIDAGTARADIQLGIAVLFGGLDRIAADAPPILKGLTEREIHTRLLAYIEDIKDRSRTKFLAHVDAPRPGRAEPDHDANE
jgi:hypothetical protein